MRPLKTQAESELELALAVKRGAVGVRDGAEAGGAVGSAEVGEAGIAAGGGGVVDDVAGGVDAGGVLMVEDVEDLGNDFEIVALADLSIFSEAGIDVVDAGVTEGVAADGGDAVVAA